MFSIKFNRINLIWIAATGVLGMIQSGCHSSGTAKNNRQLISFKAITGIHYTEVARHGNNGFSFTESGYQFLPQWKLQFLSEDTVSVYSPDKKRFANFFVTPGYDSIFNAARVWLRVKRMTKDSLILQVMRVQDDSLYKETFVNMIFCADDYIKNTLHTDTQTLKRPSRKDTLFIRALSAKANTDYKKAFAARQPVILTSRGPQVKVNMRAPEPDPKDGFNTSDYYLEPTYDITIYKAYKSFHYYFSIYVDNRGQMYYGMPLIGFMGDKDFENAYIRLSKAIMESYLKLYLNVQPGSTLGIQHTSKIIISVTGKTQSAEKN